MSTNSKNTAQLPKKRTLLDDFKEIEDQNGNKGHMEVLDSESDTNTLNHDTENNSRIVGFQNISREFIEEHSQISNASSNPYKTNSKLKAAGSVGPASTNVRTHAPQIIDEDTEHFKVKIEHLLNVFKTDAISEFMGMKRSMLEDQRCQVKSQTERYLSMYEDKHKEEAETKNKLEEAKRENQILRDRMDKMSGITQKAKQRFHTLKSLQYFFTAMKSHRNNQLVKKRQTRMAECHAAKNLKLRIFSSFARICRESKLQKANELREQEHENEIEEITSKYNKEMLALRDNLSQTQNTLQQVHLTKETLQDNLKKAFMRGVCALNFEAMNAIQAAPNLNNSAINSILNSSNNNSNFNSNINNMSNNINQNTSSAPSTYSQTYLPQMKTNNETATMQTLVLNNPQAFNSLIINPTNTSSIYTANDTMNQQNYRLNSYETQNAALETEAAASATFSQIKATQNQTNSLQGMETLDQAKLEQIDFLKRELEAIQKMVGGKDSARRDTTTGTTTTFENNSEKDESAYEDSSVQQHKRVIIFSEPKAESKDHRWKNAPVVGLPAQRNPVQEPHSDDKENNKQQNQQAIIKQDNYALQEFGLPSFSDNFGGSGEDEGRVIRVVPQKQENPYVTSIKNEKPTKQLNNNDKPPTKETTGRTTGTKPTTTASSKQMTNSQLLNTSASGKSVSSTISAQKSNLGGTPSKTQKSQSTLKK